MVSTTKVGGENTPNSKADRKKNKLKTVKVHFIGAATSDSVLHHKVVTNELDQAGQLLTLLNALSGYIEKEQMANWAKSLRNMVRKLQADFIPARVRKSNYRVPGSNPGDAFIWNTPGLNTKEDYTTYIIEWKTD